MKSLPVLMLALSAIVLLPGCPDTGIICSAGTTRCGQGCVDSAADAKNCGACGSACRSGQVCVAGGCVCNAGSVPCDGECVVLANDPKNCGACGKTSMAARCAAGEVCEASACRPSCSLAISSLNCEGACVQSLTDANNCGACGVKCEQSQSCRKGRCTYDLVAACFSSGQVVGIQSGSEFRGPVERLGTAPQSLATVDGTLLSLDGIDQQVYQARMQSVDGGAFAKWPISNATGNAPNQIVVDGKYVYIANSGSGTVQILRNYGTSFPDAGTTDGGMTDAGTTDGGMTDSGTTDGGMTDGGMTDAGTTDDDMTDFGLALVTIAELQLGMNTYPQSIAKVGDDLWVSLYGGLGAANAAAGQKVVRINVRDPSRPVVTKTLDLSTLDLKPFAGGNPVPRPQAIIGHNGALYVALNNLNAATYVPEGPGLLAKINLTTEAVTVIDLGADKCLNPGWLVSDGVRLLVSCIGAAVYSGPPFFALVKTNKSGLVLVEDDTAKSSWEPKCPAGSDGGPGCTPILPSRFAISGGRVYVGDQNGGRVFVLDINGSTLGERRGYFGDAGAAISACAPDAVTGIANVSDVLAVP